jgi:hypothetical protein
MLPKFVRQYSWYLDVEKINLQRDKKRIILNIMNYGSLEAIDWLFSIYSKDEINDVLINHGAVGELSKKSLNFWCLILNVEKNRLVTTRF